MKKTIVSFLLVVFSLIFAVSCSQPSVELTGSLSDITTKACAAADFSSVSFTYMQDEYSEEVLMYMYGIEDETALSAIEDFVVSERSGMYAATFAAIDFKDGTDSAVIDSVETLISDVYVQALITALMPYDPDQTAIAQAYEFRKYGNTLVLVISEDNTAVFDAITK